jgi:hypothetical protein
MLEMGLRRAAMLAGTVLSAVTGGMAGLVFALTRDHGLAQTVLSYQAGSFLSVMAFLAMAHRLALRRN